MTIATTHWTVLISLNDAIPINRFLAAIPIQNTIDTWLLRLNKNSISLAVRTLSHYASWQAWPDHHALTSTAYTSHRLLD